MTSSQPTISLHRGYTVRSATPTNDVRPVKGGGTRRIGAERTDVCESGLNHRDYNMRITMIRVCRIENPIMANGRNIFTNFKRAVSCFKRNWTGNKELRQAIFQLHLQERRKTLTALIATPLQHPGRSRNYCWFILCAKICNNLSSSSTPASFIRHSPRAVHHPDECYCFNDLRRSFGVHT